jgi:hypothetical protein
MKDLDQVLHGLGAGTKAYMLKSVLKKTKVERENGQNKKDKASNGSQTHQYRHKYDTHNYKTESDEDKDSDDECTNSAEEKIVNPRYVSFEKNNNEEEDGFTTVTYHHDGSGGRGCCGIPRTRSEKAKKVMQEAMNKQLNNVVAR